MANTKIGRVIKNTNHKTVTVLVVTYKNHPLYKKRYIYSKKYLVHDEEDQARLEDRVVIKQGRPISKRKHWTLDKIIDRETHSAQLQKEKATIENLSQAEIPTKTSQTTEPDDQAQPKDATKPKEVKKPVAETATTKSGAGTKPSKAKTTKDKTKAEKK